MTSCIRRREFIAGLGGAAAWPLAARAQQPALPLVGYLNSGSPEQTAPDTAAFRKGLSEAGYVEGRNVAIEYRSARNDYDRLPELAADLVGRRVAVIAALNATATALAGKGATTSIPIVFFNGSDPVQIGLVASLNRPGGNVTGVTGTYVEIGAKRLGLLHELLPRAARFAVLVNPNNSNAEVQIKDMHKAAAAIGREIEVFTAGGNRDIDTAFAALVAKRHDGLLVSSDGFFSTVVSRSSRWQRIIGCPRSMPNARRSRPAG
jgi:putative ABC transport system substrate-binding protein